MVNNAISHPNLIFFPMLLPFWGCYPVLEFSRHTQINILFVTSLHIIQRRSAGSATSAFLSSVLRVREIPLWSFNIATAVNAMAYTVDDFHWLSLLDMAIFNSYVKLFKLITKEDCKMGPYRTPHYQQSGRQKKPELIASSRRQFGHCHPSFQFRMLFQHRPRSEEAPVLIKKRCCHRNCNCWAILSIKCGMNKPTNSFKSPCRKQAPCYR